MDLDQTMIGSSSSVLDAYLLIERIDPMTTIKIPTHLVRPHLRSFINTMKKKYPHSLWFVYSAGTADYLDLMIPMVEKTCGLLFERPYFSRDDCVIGRDGIIYKSLCHIVSRIHRVYGKKCCSPKRILFFDDRPDVLCDVHERSRQVVVPPYTYEPVVIFPPEFLSKALFLRNKTVNAALKKLTHGFDWRQCHPDQDGYDMYRSWMKYIEQKTWRDFQASSMPQDIHVFQFLRSLDIK